MSTNDAVTIGDQYSSVVAAWNAQSDAHNQWSALSEEEKIEFCFLLARASAFNEAIEAAIEARPSVVRTHTESFKYGYNSALSDYQEAIRALKPEVGNG
jgi:hypothetical protein